MEIQRMIEPLTRYLPSELLMHKVEVAQRYLPDTLISILPSIDLRGDGLSLSRLLLVSERYLCDIQVSVPQDKFDFDFVLKEKLFNYRFSLWTHEIKEGSTVKASYDIARLVLFHSDVPDLRTELTYAGTKRDEWLKQVIEAIPVSLLR